MKKKLLIKGFSLLSIFVMIMISVPITACTTDYGPVIMQEIDIADFDQVQVSGVFQVDITRTNSYRVAIAAYTDLFKYFEIVKDGDSLKLGMKPGTYNDIGKPRAIIEMPDITGLSLSGATNGTVTLFNTNSPFTADVSGASSLRLNDMGAGDSKFNISGGSKLSGNFTSISSSFEISGGARIDSLSGGARESSIIASGGCQLSMINFTVDDARVTLSDGSTASLTVNNNLSVYLSSGARLDYKGNPVVNTVDVTGGASLNHK